MNWLRNLPGLPFRLALRFVLRTLCRDESLAWSWHCNLAMAFVDARPAGLTDEVHLAGNRGAAIFLSRLTQGQLRTDEFPQYIDIAFAAKRRAAAKQARSRPTDRVSHVDGY